MSSTKMAATKMKKQKFNKLNNRLIRLNHANAENKSLDMNNTSQNKKSDVNAVGSMLISDDDWWVIATPLLFRCHIILVALHILSWSNSETVLSGWFLLLLLIHHHQSFPFLEWVCEMVRLAEAVALCLDGENPKSTLILNTPKVVIFQNGTAARRVVVAVSVVA